MVTEDLRAKLKHYRLNEQEYELIKKQLGREPRGVEWALYSALWSEHCSYKSSKIHLKKFYSQSKRVLQSFGENAGVIDLGEGEKVAFKMESHNHPSFIEPYQGAATGVGGILRDIFTMGARPIMLADYLCFGEPQAERMAAIVDGVVRGIGGYGNCVGVPTVTGQTEFDRSYNSNVLVNALALGLFRPGERVLTARAHGEGNLVVYVGAKTGRDGIHGASMASESFGDGQASKKPTIQIGDPFFEKLLIESCIEVMNQDLVVAIQDMGAAGLTSSTFEMAARGPVGMKIELDRVPLRDSTLTPEEILLSESQERMLLICEPDKFAEIQKVYSRWDLDATIIGQIIAGTQVELYWKGDRLTAIEPSFLVDEAPRYERAYSPWVPRNRNDQIRDSIVPIKDVSQTLREIMGDIRSCSREWIYRQYDQRVGGATAFDCTETIAVSRLPDSGRALGLVLGCRPYLMRFDAFEGAKDAILRPALELAVKGFEPLAVTDCLNYGSPEKKDIMSEFVATIDGLNEACRALDTPVISGNVSFYNETRDRNITSTPATGLVGLRPSLKNLAPSYFKASGNIIFLLRLPQLVLSGLMSERLGKAVVGQGKIEVQPVAELVRALVKLGREPGIVSSRVVGKFGLCYALARMCGQGLGAEILGFQAVNPQVDPKAALFMENCYEVLLTVDKEFSAKVKAELEGWQKHGVKCWEIGQTGGPMLKIDELLNISVAELNQGYSKAWEKNFEALA